jgi:hypothetical protein
VSHSTFALAQVAARGASGRARARPDRQPGMLVPIMSGWPAQCGSTLKQPRARPPYAQRPSARSGRPDGVRCLDLGESLRVVGVRSTRQRTAGKSPWSTSEMPQPSGGRSGQAARSGGWGLLLTGPVSACARRDTNQPEGMSHSFLLLIPGSIARVQGGNGAPPNVTAEGRERSERPAPAVC